MARRPPGTEFSFTQTRGAPAGHHDQRRRPAELGLRPQPLPDRGRRRHNTEVLAFTGITGCDLHDRDSPPAPARVAADGQHDHDQHPQDHRVPAALQPGNSARNIYLTPPNGALGQRGPLLLANRRLRPLRSRPRPRQVITRSRPVGQHNRLIPYSITSSSGRRKTASFEDVYRRLRQIIYDWNHGSSGAARPDACHLKRVHNTIALLAQLCSEMGTLIDANPGHIKPGSDGIGATRAYQENAGLDDSRPTARAIDPIIQHRLHFELATDAAHKGAQTMAKVERGVVKPPNQELQGLAATRSAHAASRCRRGERVEFPRSATGNPGGSADLTRQAQPRPAGRPSLQCRPVPHAPAGRRASSQAKARFRSTRSSLQSDLPASLRDVPSADRRRKFNA